MAFGIGPIKVDFSSPFNPVSVSSPSGASYDPLSLMNPLKGFAFTKDILGLNKQEQPLLGPVGKRPLLKPVKPPRRRAGRGNDPFDFFGTLFTTPATSGLAPIDLLNQTV